MRHLVHLLRTKRHLRRRRGLLAGALMALVACEQSPVGPLAQDTPLLAASAAGNRPLTGEDIYRGVVFADGPVADMVPVIRDHARLSDRIKDAKQLQDVRKVQDRLIRAIQKSDPGFFDTFARDMRSGNPQAVDRALRSASAVSLRAAAAQPEVEKLRELKKSNPERYREVREALAKGSSKAKALVQNAADRQRGGGSARSVAPDADATIVGAVASVETDSVTVDPIDAALAELLDGDEPPGDPMVGGVIGLAIVAFIVIWIQAAVVQDIAAVLNIAVAVNLYAAVFATVAVVSGGGGGGCEPDPYAFDCVPAQNSLYYEQAVASTADALAQP